MNTTVVSKITDRNNTVSKITNKNPNNDKTEQSPPSNINEKGKVTAVVAVAKYGPAHHHKSGKKAAKEKLIRVLLDSGSDGDLLFHEKGKAGAMPMAYVEWGLPNKRKRQAPNQVL